MVRMWPAAVVLRWSIIDASEVDLPEPVEPTISTSPRGAMITFFSTCGSCSLDGGDHAADGADDHTRLRRAA